jgi:hypothetical protein
MIVFREVYLGPTLQEEFRHVEPKPDGIGILEAHAISHQQCCRRWGINRRAWPAPPA